MRLRAVWKRPRGPWRVLRLGLASLISLALLVPNLRLYHDEHGTGDVLAQLRYLRNALEDGAAERMQGAFPEGYFFSHVLYGLAWADLAAAEPRLRGQGMREARWALARLDSDLGRAPFDASLRPAYGVFYAGWSTWLRGRAIALGDTGQAPRFQRDAAALADGFDRSGPFLEAYPGQAWPVDSVVAAAAVRLHDRLFPPRHEAALRRWLDRAATRLDPATGLFPHQVRPQADGSRGTSQAVIQRFLIEIDPAEAGRQYVRFRRLFVVTRLGLPGIREYPPGRSGGGDVDSGPLILGVSASATAVALGAARVHGDTRLAGPLTALGEAAGMPVRLPGGKRYAFGVLPVGDAFLAWSASARPAGAESYGRVVRPWWRLPWHLLSLALITLLWLPAFRRRPARRERPAVSGPGSPSPRGRPSGSVPDGLERQDLR